jgi:hypothetical protein
VNFRLADRCKSPLHALNACKGVTKADEALETSLRVHQVPFADFTRGHGLTPVSIGQLNGRVDGIEASNIRQSFGDGWT